MREAEQLERHLVVTVQAGGGEMLITSGTGGLHGRLARMVYSARASNHRYFLHSLPPEQ